MYVCKQTCVPSSSGPASDSYLCSDIEKQTCVQVPLTTPHALTYAQCRNQCRVPPPASDSYLCSDIEKQTCVQVPLTTPHALTYAQCRNQCRVPTSSAGDLDDGCVTDVDLIPGDDWANPL